ncbi:MAG: DUF6580 family putative transport protein [Fuerstiella sp.]
MTTNQKYVIAAACLITIVFRLHVPGLPNFGTMVALSLLCGCAFKNGWGFAIPLGIRMLTDIGLELQTGYGFYSSWAYDYSAYLLIAFLGYQLNSKSALQVGAGTLTSVTIFFLISNFGAWHFEPSYTSDFAGLWLCFELGLPFAKATIYGNLLAAPVFFGSWHFATITSTQNAATSTQNAASRQATTSADNA